MAKHRGASLSREHTPRTHALATATALLWVLAASGCADDALEAGASSAACTTGDVRACSCLDGEAEEICNLDGEWAGCPCDGSAPSCGTPGHTRPCRCSDGRRGVALCRDDGTRSACQCAALPSSDADEVPEDDTTTQDTADAVVESDGPGIAPAVARCCHELGTCLDAKLLPPVERALVGRADCGDVEQVCIPDALTAPAGFSLETCRSVADVEGRCVLDCLPSVAAQADLLPRDACDDHERCVPCFDPFTGAATGVCELGSGDYPAEDPAIFERCCGGAGQCLPASLVPEDASDGLAPESCDTSQDLLCVPDLLATLEDQGLPPCRAFGVAEGRCLPPCLAALPPEQEAWLSQADCDAGQLCTPCFDPVSGDATGVCELGADPGPAEPPLLFARCCEVDTTPVGRCLPRALVPEAAAALPELECGDTTLACVPDVLLQPGALGFAACTGRLGADGACLPLCLVDSNLTPLLARDVCDSTQLCVPCQIGGTPTGACDGA